MDIFNLKNKTIIITGGAGFLGYQHAEAILEKGGKIILIDSNTENLNKLKKILDKNFPHKVKNFTADITNEADIKKITTKLEKTKIYGLINNAAINPIVEKKKYQF